jgi:hypothetical protein
MIVTHIYSRSGFYYVRLTITDNWNAYARIKRSITVFSKEEDKNKKRGKKGSGCGMLGIEALLLLSLLYLLKTRH